MLNPFFNADQKRLRALWRLAIFLVALMLGFGAAGALMKALRMPSLTQWCNNIAIIATLLFAAKALDKRPMKSFGFAFDGKWWIDFGFGAVLGGVLMAIVFCIELAFGMLRVTGFAASRHGQPFWQGIGFSFVFYVGVALQEEILMRGYLLRNLAEGFKAKTASGRGALIAAYALSSSVFGLLHMGNQNASVASGLLLILAGLLLGLPYLLSGELSIPLGLHLGWNFFQGSVFGFPVSGGSYGPSFIGIDQGGPTWFSGGAFGPEGGLAGVIAMGIGSLLICLWIKRRRGELRPFWDLAVYRDAQPGSRPEPPEARNPSA
jgi:membrane protease YdiL (CAAX protease family)